MACSLSYITNETFRSLNIEDFATSMSFNLVKSKPVPLDIVSIQLCDDTFVQSFLSVQWAIIADVDLESENYRYLGEFRFTIGAIKRILGKYFFINCYFEMIKVLTHTKIKKKHNFRNQHTLNKTLI